MVTAPPPVAGEPLPTNFLTFVSPMDGDLAEPGDTLDVTVDTGAAGLLPTLLVNDVETPVTWQPDPNAPTALHASFTVPADASGSLRLVAAADDALAAEAKLNLTPPVGKSSGTVAGATTLALPSGAKLMIPKGALPDGTTVTFSSYAPNTAPEFATPTLVSPIYRVHVSADETAITGSLFIDQPLSISEVAGLDATPNRLLSLQVFESAPDPEDASPSVRARLQRSQDGSGVVHAELAPNAFHHTGSSSAISGLEATPYPFVLSSAQLCASDTTDTNVVDCQPMSGAGTATVGMACGTGTSTQTAHLSVKASLAWQDNPPTLVSPLEDAAAESGTPSPPYATDAFNPLRKRPNAAGWRPHQGNDMRARKPWPLFAAADGLARAHMSREYFVEIALGKWTIRNFHVSDFTGFSQKFAAGDVLGSTWKTVGTGKKKKTIQVDVTAPVDDVYSLSCFEAAKKGSLVPLVCHVNRAGGSSPALPDLIALPEGTWAHNVKAGDLIGMTGRSGVGVPNHLHFEFWYGPGHTGVPIDAALFFPSISGSSLVNGSASPLETPTLRFAAELSPGNGNTANGGISDTILGIDPATLRDATEGSSPPPVACPYAGSMAPTYRVVKMRGPKEPLTDVINWDLGPCVYASVCDPNAPQDVKVTLGSTTWRRTSKADYPPAAEAWNLLNESGTFPTAPPLVISEDVFDGVSATVNVAVGSAKPQASDFEGMTVAVNSVSGEFAGSTMTLTNVVLVGLPSQYAGSFNGPEAGNPTPLSTNIPANATVFKFGDNLQSAGVAGFPSPFSGTNVANRNGRSNLIAVWQDVTKKWQWVWNVSGGSYNSGGGFPQWHEYQFIYDSRKPTAGRTRYDVFLGPSGVVPANSSGWSYIRTAATTVTVVMPKKTGYVLPGQ